MAAALLGSTAQAEEPASFKFSLDPTVIVLSVTYTAPMSRISREHLLYGDGRFVISTEDNHGIPIAKHEVLFTYAECEELLRLLVDHGIVEISTDELITKIKKRMTPGHSMYIAEDAGDMILEIHLESYTRPGQEPISIDNQLRIHAPKAMYRIVPDLLELQGLFEFNNRMDDLYLATRVPDEVTEE
ncbi:MAG: hypothetical protein HC897_16885 [Thermoanaerobaculia bacterium]|nr:hypothetical protein [Thermoanaerobaculia bacterium]